jgi:hypothetical protein
LFHSFFDWLNESIQISRAYVQHERDLVRQITELSGQGKSNSEIAQALGYSETSIAKRRIELNTQIAV